MNKTVTTIYMSVCIWERSAEKLKKHREEAGVGDGRGGGRKKVKRKMVKLNSEVERNKVCSERNY